MHQRVIVFERRDSAQSCREIVTSRAWCARTGCSRATLEVCMPLMSEITFHNMGSSDAITRSVQSWTARLDHVYRRILACDVVIDQPHKHSRHGAPFRVSIVVNIPGRDLATHSIHEDVYVAIANAFRAARRQLVDAVDVQRGEVKTHVYEGTGHVSANIDKSRSRLL
jgi:ribosome-associated translation inhibitor RaiA